MRAAVVGLTHPFRGGIAHYTTFLVRALQAEHEVRLFALRKQYPSLLFPGRTQLDESRRVLEVPNEASLVPWSPWTWLSTARAIARFAPQVAIFQYWHPFFAPAFGTLSRLLPRRCRPIWELHNVLPHEPSLVDRALVDYGFGAADAFLVHAEAERAALEALRPGCRVRVVPHASYADLSAGQLSRSEARAQLGISDDAPLLLFFGYVRRYKGLDILLDAMPAIHAQSGARLLVRGEFYEPLADYSAQVEALGLEACVDLQDRFVANEEIPLLLAACDLVVLPYRSGTASGVLQLALGAGRPVVITRVGGVAESVVEGETGFVAAQPEPGAVTAQVLRYLSPETERGAMERAAARTARERFGWEHAVRAIEELAG